MSEITYYLVSMLLRGAVLFLLVIGLERFLPRLRPLLQRRLVWLCFPVLLLAPVHPASLIDVEPRRESLRMSSETLGFNTELPLEFTPALFPAVQLPDWQQAAAQPERSLLPYAAAALYLLAALLLAGRASHGFLTWRKRLTGLPEVADERISRLFRQELMQSGFPRRPPRLADGSGQFTGPACFGFLSGTVILPVESVKELPDMELRFVLRHELAHLKHFDNLLNLGWALLTALFWFNPFLWWMKHRWLLAAELCCDREATAAACDRSTCAGYARLLLYFSSGSVPVPPGGEAMSAPARELRVRIKALFNAAGSSRAFRTGALVFAVAVTAGIIFLTPALAAEKERDIRDYIPGDAQVIMHFRIARVLASPYGPMIQKHPAYQLCFQQSQRQGNPLLFPHEKNPLKPTEFIIYSLPFEMQHGTGSLGVIILRTEQDWRQVSAMLRTLPGCTEEKIQGKTFLSLSSRSEFVAALAYPVDDHTFVLVPREKTIFNNFIENASRDFPYQKELRQGLNALPADLFGYLYMGRPGRGMTNDGRRPLLGFQVGPADGGKLTIDGFMEMKTADGTAYPTPAITAGFWNSWLRAITGNNQELFRKFDAASKFKVVPGGFRLHAQLERQDIPEALNCFGNFLKVQEGSYTLKKKEQNEPIGD
ncbi:M56 family metallopeptidase [Victivallis vadensis]|uniref:M56 family metallopeptidase n=1 Tax=Victivallis vadensis TaxID=172901 RepID=UPI00266BF4B7|nr:M56 family metallopeptidase [Victivallis vadensis]